MITKTFIIQNKYGLHARPAALFVQATAEYESEVFIEKDGVEVNGRSIMGVLMLAAEKGSKITLKVDGDDEAAAIDALVALLNGNLDNE